jgi:hypothetical protein
VGGVNPGLEEESWANAISLNPPTISLVAKVFNDDNSNKPYY